MIVLCFKVTIMCETLFLAAKNSMLDVCPADMKYGSQAICILHLQHPNP